MNRIGIDLGATKIECCVINENNEIVFRERILTGATNGKEFVVSNIKTLYNFALEETNNQEHALGLCMPGSISYKTGLVKNSSILSLNNINFKQLLETELSHQVNIANDSHCFALAEATVGAGKNYDFVLGIILGTGVGGAIVSNKNTRIGIHGISGEWGHTNLDLSNKIKCRCGRTGCVETWIGGSGFEIWAERLTGVKASAKEYITDKKVKYLYFDMFGLALANMIQILDPDCIVIGGGISNNEELYTLGIESIKKYLFNDEFNTPILQAKLGDSAGVVGAAFIG